MTKWELYYRAGDDWDYTRDIAAAGYIQADCDYNVSAFSYGPNEIFLEGGTPVWATFNQERSDANAPGYDIWYVDDYGNDQWLDGGDGGDIWNNEYIQWEEEIFDELEQRYRDGEFSEEW